MKRRFNIYDPLDRDDIAALGFRYVTVKPSGRVLSRHRRLEDARVAARGTALVVAQVGAGEPAATPILTFGAEQ